MKKDRSTSYKCTKHRLWSACRVQTERRLEYCRKTISLLILCDMRGRGCHIGIKRQWRKGAEVEQRESWRRRRNELLQWRCVDDNDLSKALAYLHFKLIFSYSAFDSLPLVCLFCQYICLIYRFLLSAPLAPHIPALTMNSQHRQVKQPVTAEAAFILITAREKLSTRITLFQALLQNLVTPSIFDEWLCNKDLIWPIWKPTERNHIYSILFYKNLTFYNLDQLQANMLAVSSPATVVCQIALWVVNTSFSTTYFVHI